MTNQWFFLLQQEDIFRTEKFFIAQRPCALQNLHVEKLLKLRGYILEEREHPAARMLIPHSIHNEAFLSYKSVAVSGSPLLGWSRFDAPPYESSLRTKKPIAQGRPQENESKNQRALMTIYSAYPLIKQELTEVVEKAIQMFTKTGKITILKS